MSSSGKSSVASTSMRRVTRRSRKACTSAEKAPASERLADQLTYLRRANAHLDGLHPTHALTAMAIPA